MEVVFHSQEHGGPLQCEQALKIEIKVRDNTRRQAGISRGFVDYSENGGHTDRVQTDTEGWL